MKEFLIMWRDSSVFIIEIHSIVNAQVDGVIFQQATSYCSRYAFSSYKLHTISKRFQLIFLHVDYAIVFKLIFYLSSPSLGVFIYL